MENIYTRPALERGSFQVISYDGIQFGYSFRFQTQDTRGIYLSCLESFQVELDGKPVSPYDMTIRVDGGEYPVSQMPELAHVVMDLGKSATVKVRDYGDLTGEHVLSLSFDDRVPFINRTGATVAAPTRDSMKVRG
jgi:hypothetical protein